MADKPTPKYKKDDVVYDRELHVQYVVDRFAYHQLNGDPWYYAKVQESGARAFIAESWLTLVERASLKKYAKGLHE